MMSLARAALKRYSPVAKNASAISIEELDKITMHLHKSKRISKDVSTLLLEESVKSIEAEPNIIHWNKHASRRAPRTFVFANLDLTYEKLHHLISPTSLQYPSPDNQYVFLGCKFLKSSDHLRGLLSLLTMRMLCPQSVCILRSRTFDQLKVSSTDVYSGLFNNLENSLPLSLIVDNQIMITNGGVANLTSEMSIDDLQRLSRSDQSNKAIFNELISAVPSDRSKKNEKNDLLFNSSHLDPFLNRNKLNLLIRNSVDPAMQYKVTLKSKCISFNGLPVTNKSVTSRAKQNASPVIQPVTTKFGHNISSLALLRGKDKPVVGYKMLNL